MPTISDRIENVLNETRILLLGGQVLLGFSYRIVFEPRFDRIPFAAQVSMVAALIGLSAALGVLIWPAAFHRIAEHGWQTQRIHSFTTAVLDWALLPFAVGLGCTLYPVNVVMAVPHAILIAALATAVALSAWYGAILMRHQGRTERVRRELREEESKQDPRKDLGERVKKVLIECRMALPGAQAFLGFQFSIVFMEDFARLPRSWQWIHFGSLLATTVAIVLLIAPAAYHRIAERGDDSERFHAIASYLLLGSLVFLAPGMAGDVFVVLAKVSRSPLFSGVLSGVLLFLFYLLWFGLSFLARWKQVKD